MMNAAIMLGLTLCILGLLNYLAFKHPYSKDISPRMSHSITPQSQQVIKQFSEEIEFLVFARKNKAYSIKKILNKYAMVNSKVKISIIDPDLDPNSTQKFGISANNELIIKYQKRWVLVKNVSELDITNALIKLTRTKAPVIYYTTGHGEFSFEGADKNGMGQLREILKQSFFELRHLNLANLGQVPPDADCLIIWGAKSTFMKVELDAISKFLGRGVRLLYGLMPEFNAKTENPLFKLLNDQGIKINNNLVFDPQLSVSGSKGSVPLVVNYSKNHLITRGFKGQTFFPFSVSLERAAHVPENNHISFLAQTSEGSYAKSNFSQVGKGQWGLDSVQDKMGPLSIVAAVEEIEKKPEQKTKKIVVFGNSTFVSNVYFGQGKNIDFFLNALSWLVEEGQFISLERPFEAPKRLVLSAPHKGVIFYFSVFFAPLILLLMSILMYRRKAKL